MIIALIILVAMTLAGIGLMRSADTGNMIAGNMAFRQAALNATDAGTGIAFNALMNIANSGNPADLQILWYDNGQPCPSGATPTFCAGGVINFPGYTSSPLAACEVTGPPCPSAASWWTVPANWAGAYTLTAAQYPDTTTTVQYVIHRMCQLPNTPPTTGVLCQTYTPSNNNGQTGGQGTGQITPSPSVYYQITVRVTGPRNTTSYAQITVQQISS